MAIRFTVGGISTVIPGVYSQFFVQNSLPAPAPAGRSVFIFGEAEEGIPGSELDIRLNFFTDFQSVQDFYKSGPVVDAARMLFSNQPSQIFAGNVDRLYIYKTNNSTRATRAISSPVNYGTIAAARFGESGNLIKTQITDAQTEVKPEKTFLYLPTPEATDFRVMVNGELNAALSVAANGTADDFATALAGVTGLTVTGGDVKTDITGGVMDVSLSASGDQLTVTKTGDAGVFDATSIEAGDVLYVVAGTALAGALDENAGAYLVESVSSTTLVAKQLKHVSTTAVVNAVDFDLTPVTGLAAGDLLINAPVTLSVTGTTPAGAGATLELLEDSASNSIYDTQLDESLFSNLLSNSTSSIANISATVPSAGKLTISLDAGSWQITPKVGDLVRIDRGSLLEGATSLNVGYLVVEAAGPQSLTVAHLHSGMTTEAVTSVALSGQNDTLLYAPSFTSSETAARRIDSSSERKVEVNASRDLDGQTLPDNSIGGNVVFEFGYYNAAATACTLSITSQRQLVITPAGVGLSETTVNLRKYSTLGELVSFLNTQTGFFAKVSKNSFLSLPTSVLDAVDTIDCLNGQALPAYNAKVKKDYFDFVQFFEQNFGFVAFSEGTARKVGLPAAEVSAAFLTGADIGFTTNLNCQLALDAALKVSVRNVVPLFSRDSLLDVADGLTDSRSTYTIGSIHAATSAHVSTASSTLNRKRRFAVLSFDGTFTDSQEAASAVSFERCQMTFQRNAAVGADGTSKLFLPWMSACAIAAARSQAVLGTSMLRKPLLLSSAEHTGAQSLFDDTLTQDFEPDSLAELAQAIEAGLLVFRAVPGFGVRVESPDNTTRSRDNDPQAWLYERINVHFTVDQVLDLIEQTLENFIGNRQSDTSTAVVRQAVNDTLGVFLNNGSLLAAQVTKVERVGATYQVELQVQPVEALEAISVTAYANRDLV